METPVGESEKVLILLTSGEYSSYGVEGLYEVPSYQWVEDRLKEFRAAHPEQEGDYNPDVHAFRQWLTTRDGVRRVEYREVHLTSTYGWPDSVFEQGMMDSESG